MLRICLKNVGDAGAPVSDFPASRVVVIMVLCSTCISRKKVEYVFPDIAIILYVTFSLLCSLLKKNFDNVNNNWKFSTLNEN